MASPALPEPPSTRDLLRSTAAAFGVAMLVLVVAVLPAEYGIDPTGIGGMAGFTKISDARSRPANLTGEEGRVLYQAQASWILTEVQVGVLEGRSVGLSEQTHTMRVNVTNLTSVTARLEWQDEPAHPGEAAVPDRFVIRVLPPEPDRRIAKSPPGYSDATGAGNVSATFAWRPDALPSERDGALRFPLVGEDSSGVGAWRFDVWLQEIGGEPQDKGDAWVLNVTAQRYAFTARVDDAPGDTVRITLRPGDSIEYKFAMNAGARLDYTWSSDQPLFSDLHGDQPGTNLGAAYKSGTFASDEGSFEAEFTGRHGWYWQNEGTETAHLVLVTRGDYAILGTV